MSPKADRAIPPRRPLCLMALPARSPTGLGLTPSLAPILGAVFLDFSWDLACLWLCDTESATRKKSHIFPKDALPFSQTHV